MMDTNHRHRAQSLYDAFARAILDGDKVVASRIRMTIAAAEMMEVAADIIDLIVQGTVDRHDTS